MVVGWWLKLGEFGLKMCEFREQNLCPGERRGTNGLNCIRPDSSHILRLSMASEKKKKSHGKGAVILSHNTLSCRSNLTCLRAILPSENLLHANAAKEHT